MLPANYYMFLLQYARKYAQGLFWPDIMSSFPMVAISQIMFKEIKVSKVEGIPLILFHTAFVMNLLRLASMQRCWRYFHNLADVSIQFTGLY